MNIFLPVAQVSVGVPLMVGFGAAVGFLSGLFGVGGAFLLTPLLMFAGISPTVAAATGAAGIVAAAAAGALEHSRAHTLDYKIGATLFVGGALGSYAGVELLFWLNGLGPANVVIRVLYVLLLWAVGLVMLVESVLTWRRGIYMSERRFEPVARPTWVDALPLRMEFPKSEVSISLLLPFGIGVLGGGLAAIMGVGGGFIMVPLMLYVLRMRMHVVTGTSLFQILLTCMLVTVLQASQNHTVDLLLALLLATGSAAGAMMGARFGRRMRAEQLKVIMAVITLGVGIEVFVQLVQHPSVLLSHVAGH